MATIRSKTSNRFFFLILVSLISGLIVYTVAKEHDKEWKEHQLRYIAMYRDLLSREIESKGQEKETQDMAALKKLYADISAKPDVDIQQVFLPDADVRDLCMTCHMAVKNPFFKHAAQPLKTHPPETLKTHAPRKFGCTLCHHGQGVALTAIKAHGFENNWLRPRVPPKYVQGLCLGCHENTYGLKGAETVEKGRRLFTDWGCYGCHKDRSTQGLPFMAPPLDSIGLKVENIGWLLKWVDNPGEIRPKTLMPNFRFKQDEAEQIAACLLSWKEDRRNLMARHDNKGSAKEGKRLFVEKGCAACHGVATDEPCLTNRIPNLADAGIKLNPKWVAAWIEHPSALVDETAMPRLMLEDNDINKLSSYIISLKAADARRNISGVDTATVQGTDIAKGERLIKHYGCYGCHPVKGMEQMPLVGVDVSGVADKRMEEFPFGNANIDRTKWDWLYHKILTPDIYKTEDMPLKMPDYAREGLFTSEDAEAITAFYLCNKKYDIPARYHYRTRNRTRMLKQGDQLIDRFNCRGCHQIEEETKPRLERFLNLKSMVPPRLVGEGERVQPQWFFTYLAKPDVLRPWLNIRMPEFNLSYAQKEIIIDYFSLQAAARRKKTVTTPYVMLPVRSDYDDEIIEMGEYRVVTDKCMQCHPVSLDDSLPEDVKLEDLSINLMLSKKRLRYDWIMAFLRDPDRFAGKGTKMPFVYYTPDKVPRISNPEMWIEYTALYLMFMEKVPEMKKAADIEDVRPGTEIDWTSY